MKWLLLSVLLMTTPVLGLEVDSQAQGLQLNSQQSQRFRAWFVRLVDEQIRRPSPRWVHRDCAGLIRFAVSEALAEHDLRWQQASGIAAEKLPPPLTLQAQQRQQLRFRWQDIDGEIKAFVTAQALVQHNSVFVGRSVNDAQPGDLLFFDQGDAQHLMVWMGQYIAYHTGTVTPNDNGLRAVSLQQMTQWKDTRWQPTENNPNFLGFYRLGFLSR